MVSQQKQWRPGSSIVFSVHYKKITANPGLWEGSFKKEKKIERPEFFILLYLFLMLIPSFENTGVFAYTWC